MIRLLALIVPETFPLEGGIMEGMKSIFPLTSIGLGGLIFNTLCLRSVDTTYFQVSSAMAMSRPSKTC